jgi:cytochrome c peroxidase
LSLTCLAALSACTVGAQETENGPPPAGAGVLDLPETPYNYADLDLPAHFETPFARETDNTPADNPITDSGATLGRVLFYDTTLSKNDTIACASCHRQADAFAEPEAFSVGFEGGLTGRNSMGLSDARYYARGRFFWDKRAATLEDQVLMPIQHPVEMGLTLEQLVERVAGQEYYPEIFEQAFGDSEVTVDRISKALAQFVRSMVSYQSPFDDGLVVAGDVVAPFPTFTPGENAGKALFLGRAGCANCHLDDGPPHPGPRVNQANFYIRVPVNNGLDDELEGDDNGMGDISGNLADNGHFKSPSLRNVARTAPYMHDGRFATLGEVIEHYNSGVQAHPNLDRRLQNPPPAPPEPRRLNLTETEKAALKAFLETLTDEAMMADPKYSSPFVEEIP